MVPLCTVPSMSAGTYRPARLPACRAKRPVRPLDSRACSCLDGPACRPGYTSTTPDGHVEAMASGRPCECGSECVDAWMSECVNASAGADGAERGAGHSETGGPADGVSKVGDQNSQASCAKLGKHTALGASRMQASAQHRGAVDTAIKHALRPPVQFSRSPHINRPRPRPLQMHATPHRQPLISWGPTTPLTPSSPTQSTRQP